MNEIRPLTQTEIDSFPGQSHVDVAVQSTDGRWYYGESYQTQDEHGNTIDTAMFVTDEGGDYIPV